MTDSTDNALKPCPFCGSRGIDRDTYWHRDYCTNCGGKGPAAGNSVKAGWNTRADLAPDPLRAVKVKPLVWEDFEGRGAKASAFYSANYLINLWNGRGQFEVSLSYPGHQTGYDGERWHDTLEAAKAAAQADYAARIMAALEPCDPLADARVKALVEALNAMLEHSCVADAGPDMKDPEDHAAESKALAALAAFDKGGKDE